MQTSINGARGERSYSLAHSAVIHKVAKQPSAAIYLATHCPYGQSTATEPLFEVSITVECIQVAHLRRIATEICGDKIDLVEILPTKKPSQQLLRLRCFGKPVIYSLMSAVVSQLESAEFGRVYAV